MRTQLGQVFLIKIRSKSNTQGQDKFEISNFTNLNPKSRKKTKLIKKLLLYNVLGAATSHKSFQSKSSEFKVLYLNFRKTHVSAIFYQLDQLHLQRAHKQLDFISLSTLSQVIIGNPTTWFNKTDLGLSSAAYGKH